MEEDTIEADVLIIGAGIAGCRAAIEAHNCGSKVVITTKGLFGKDCGATWMATCGYNCWGIYPYDTLDMHVEDTLRCGWFLNNQENVYAFLAHVPDTALELLEYGVRYKMKNGKFETMWGLGCSTNKGRMIYPVTYPWGHLGYNYSRILPPLIRAREINVLEDTFISDLLTRGDVVVGAIGIDIRTGRFKVLKAKATLLATGGYQGLYKVTTASPNLTGDGQAMALRAGVDMMDFEFNQTQVRALWPPQLAGSMLPFTMIMDWGAHMYNIDNERFMAKWDPIKMEHTTRAVISRAIFHEVKAGKGSPHGGIYVSVTHKPKSFIKKKLREIEGTHKLIQLEQSGLDLCKDHIEAGYAIHYCQGGCNVSSKCETDKPGLFAIGEAASGGKDGSDRMMSNALPYCMAMGIIGGRVAAQRAKIEKMPEIDRAQVEELQWRSLRPMKRKDGVRVYQVKPLLQDRMQKKTSYGRTEEGLKSALSEVERYKNEVIPNLWVPNKKKTFNIEWINVLEFENLVLVAECLIRNALMRTESRGLHDRWDHPQPDPNWFKNIHIRLVNGEWKQWTTPVEFTYWKPEEGSLGEPWCKGVQVKEYTGWRAEPLYKGT